MRLDELQNILHGDVADADLLYLFRVSETGLARSKKLTVAELKELLAPEEPAAPTFFESDPVDMGPASFLVAHSLATQPRWVQVMARCVESEFGWQVGDEMQVVGYYAPSSYIVTVWADDETVGCLMPHTTILAMRRDNTEGFELNTAKWKLIFRVGV